MDVSKFLSLLSKRELWLARSDTFKDKREGIFHPAMKLELDAIYESLITQGNIPSDSDIKNADDYQLYLKNNSYISCWHKNADENMIMWEIYGQTENSVAIKTTAKSLKNSFDLNDLMKFSLEVALDEVSYAEPGSVRSEQNSRQPFFIKRSHFFFEKEVRLYLRAKHAKSVDNAPLGYSIPVDLAKLINEIYVHPDAQDWFFESIKDVVQKYGIKALVTKGVCGNKF